MKAKIGVLGSGTVGQTLADGFLKYGHPVMRASRDPSKLADWLARAGEGASTGTFGEATAFAEIIVLAVKGSAARDALGLCLANHLVGKTIIDTTNPISDEPPVNGVLHFFTGPNTSLLEALQELVPDAHFVKAFSCVGSALMVDPQLPGGPPTMFICGNDDGAKAEVRDILNQFGWGIEDLGGAEAARAIEPLCMLWCIPGLREGRWNHAFKLLTT